MEDIILPTAEEITGAITESEKKEDFAYSATFRRRYTAEPSRGAWLERSRGTNDLWSHCRSNRELRYTKSDAWGALLSR